MTPETAVRFAYARRYKRLPLAATPEVDAVLKGERRKPQNRIVGLMLNHFESLLKPYNTEGRGKLVLEVGNWQDERATVALRVDPVKEKAGMV